MVELGFADFDVSAWYGLAAPAGLPAEVLKKLEAALEKAAKDPELLKTMEAKGADVGFLGASLMGSFMAVDGLKWKRVASFAKIELNTQ
jgi:tripartite-type tricarboxylate transporter receptor subunit TctC